MLIAAISRYRGKNCPVDADTISRESNVVSRRVLSLLNAVLVANIFKVTAVVTYHPRFAGIISRDTFQ